MLESNTTAIVTANYARRAASVMGAAQIKKHVICITKLDSGVQLMGAAQIKKHVICAPTLTCYS